MKKLNVLTRMLLLCALIVGSSSVWAETVSTVTASKPSGNTAPSSWSWTGSESVSWGATVTWKKSAPSATNVTEGYYQMGTKNNPATSIVFSTSSITERITKIVVNCASYNGLGTVDVTVGGNDFGTQGQSIPKWSSSIGGDLTFTGGAKGNIVITMTNGDSGRAMYIKSITVTYGTTNPSAIFEGKQEAIITVDGGSISSNKWTMTGNDDYTLSGTSLSQRSNTDYFKIVAGTYTITVPSTLAVNKMAIEGYSTSGDGTPVTVGSTSVTFTQTPATVVYDIATPTAGADVSFTTSTKEMDIISIVLYSNDGITLRTTATMDGWRAFDPAGQGYTLDANTKAYIITAEPSEGKATLVELAGNNGDIPGNTPVILKTNADNHEMILTKNTVANYSGATNLLKVTEAADDLSSGVYRLGYGADGVGFYPYSVASAAAGIVYLDVAVPSSDAKGLTLAFDEGETDGINAVVKNAENGIRYNLAGQKVDAAYKGIVIVNGKKYINK